MTAHLSGRTRTNQRCIAFHPKAGQRPIFWVNPGYQQLAVIKRMGSDQPVYCLYRDKPDPKKRPLSFHQIAAYHIETMRQVSADGPYPIIGYCVYGAVAFQMACELAAQGQKAAPLIMIDPSDPALSRINPLPRPLASQAFYQLHRARFHLKRIRALPAKAQLGYVTDSLGRATKALLETVQTQMLWRNGWPGAEKTVPPHLLEIHQADIYAYRVHKLDCYQGSGILFRPKEVPNGAHDYSNRRWARLIAGQLDIEDVPGDSDSMWTSPDSEPLARAILSYSHQQA